MQFNDSSPIWLQLVDECARRVVTGQWPVGGRVPAVRELAVDLGVNPNTVQRAMAELDRRGITISERTAGRYVTNDAAAVDELRQALATAHADEFIARAQGLGMSLERAEQLIKKRWHHREGDMP